MFTIQLPVITLFRLRSAPVVTDSGVIPVYISVPYSKQGGCEISITIGDTRSHDEDVEVLTRTTKFKDVGDLKSLLSNALNHLEMLSKDNYTEYVDNYSGTHVGVASLIPSNVVAAMKQHYDDQLYKRWVEHCKDEPYLIHLDMKNNTAFDQVDGYEQLAIYLTQEQVSFIIEHL